MGIYRVVFETRSGTPFHGRLRHANASTAYLVADGALNANDEGQLRFHVAPRNDSAIEIVSAECRVDTLILSGNKFLTDLRVINGAQTTRSC